MNENELIRVLTFCLIKLQTLKLHELAESRSLIILTDEIGYFDVSTRPMLSLLPVACRFRVSKQAPDNFNNVIILVYFFCSRESTTYWSTFDAFWLINSSDTDNRHLSMGWNNFSKEHRVSIDRHKKRKQGGEFEEGFINHRSCLHLPHDRFPPNLIFYDEYWSWEIDTCEVDLEAKTNRNLQPIPRLSSPCLLGAEFFPGKLRLKTFIDFQLIAF